jgi:hypothetical protein
MARNAVQGELASKAQLVIVGLHAQYQPTLATRDVAAEML